MQYYLEMGPLGGNLGLDVVMRVEPPRRHWCPYRDEETRALLSAMWCYSKKGAICKLGVGLSPDTKSTSALTPGLPRFEVWEINAHFVSHQCIIFLLEQPTKTEIRAEKWGCYCNRYLKMQTQLWNWVMGRSRKILRCILEKSQYYCEGTAKGDSGESSKRGEES